ncbi:MAG: ABC transporter ATP-binding protein [Sphingobium sp.]|jgi:iron complex transport system ATP-binding protein|nr:ABC transporter ATP-binding protein [Sphingobium sp.]MCI1272719.1 ABC transporter ATP-binding protein [Sphingobium sp.]MCI1756635.1 ABC transporter ATP-binding protein [Sphingobium sp.]MCI2052942.1 ABC transporter ATP-binding protein [Sphingobium sp.]
MNALVASDVTKMLGGREVLRSIDARFAPGHVSVILGPNGAGKSTLMGLLTGLHTPDRGAITLDSQDILALSPRERARRIGYLPQSAALHWDLDVRDLVALGRIARRGRFARETDADCEAIARALAETDTQGFAQRRAGSLSGGERARVLLARVLAGEPDWILADEPLESLDPAHQIEVLALFRAIAARGTGVVLVLHDLTLAHSMADEILMLKDGRVVAHGPRDIMESPGLLQSVYGLAFDVIERAGAPSVIVPSGLGAAAGSGIK